MDIEDGVPVLARFRGLLEYPNIQYSKSMLKSLDDDDLVEHLLLLQAGYNEKWDRKKMIDIILKRYENKEPAMCGSHYISRNKGRFHSEGLMQFVNCGDSEALFLDDPRNGECRLCHARIQGDQGVGLGQPNYFFSFWDYRQKHQVLKKSGDKEYIYCTLEAKGHCKHCSINKKVGWSEKTRSRENPIPGARPLYEVGMTYLNLRAFAADQLIACEQRISKYCRSCGDGRLRPVGAFCPEEDCGEAFDWDDLISDGWAPDDPDIDNRIRKCPHCYERVVPELELECSGCDDPVRGRLCDADIVIMRTKSGKNNYAWSFTEQLPLRPLNPFESDVDKRILAAPLPDYEEPDLCGPPSIDEQLKQLGAAIDPVTGEEAPMRRKAPVVGKRRRHQEEDEEERPRKKKRKKKKGSPFGGKKKKKKGGISLKKKVEPLEDFEDLEDDWEDDDDDIPF